METDDLSPRGELVSQPHPFFHPGVCPSRIGGCRVLPSAPGWVVTQAEGNLPGVPAVHMCVDAYRALRLCSVPNALGVPALLAAELSARGWSTSGKEYLAWYSHFLTSRSRDRLYTRGQAPFPCWALSCPRRVLHHGRRAVLLCRSSTRGGE